MVRKSSSIGIFNEDFLEANRRINQDYKERERQRIEGLKNVDKAREAFTQIRQTAQCKFFEHTRNLDFEFSSCEAIARFVEEGAYTYWDLSITRHDFDRLKILLFVAEARMQYDDAMHHWARKSLGEESADKSERMSFMHRMSMATYCLKKKRSRKA